MTSTGTSSPAALVTGASRGIGYELANCCAEDGYDLVLVARGRERLEAVAAEFESRWGVATTPLSADLSRPEAATEIYEAVAQEDRRVEVLVNCAGTGPGPDRLDEADPEATLGLLRTNVLTLTRLTGLFVSPMVQRGAGRVLNVSSVAGELPDPRFGVYAATKGYVSTLSAVLARRLEPLGVTVTVLVPGWTDTEMAAEVFRTLNIDPDTVDVMSPEAVARAGYEGLVNGQARVVPGEGYRAALRTALTNRAEAIDP